MGAIKAFYHKVAAPALFLQRFSQQQQQLMAGLKDEISASFLQCPVRSVQ